MSVLAVVHGTNVPPGSFGEELDRLGREVDEWSLAWGTPPPRPIDEYGAVMLFGGSMHADEDDHHPWLREETLLVQRLLDQRVPLLGVCLGAQLIARAAHAPVSAMCDPEIGWVEVEHTPAARDDPVFSKLPECFEAFQWHFYEFGLPAGAVELARSRDCSQAFRLGDVAWGVQFHPEIMRPVVEDWISESPEALTGSAQEFLATFDAHEEEWAEIGRTLCGSFVDAADRVAVAA